MHEELNSKNSSWEETKQTTETIPPQLPERHFSWTQILCYASNKFVPQGRIYTSKDLHTQTEVYRNINCERAFLAAKALLG